MAPIGVIEVRPVELMAMRQNPNTSTTATTLIHHCTPKNDQAMYTTSAPSSGMPTRDTLRGSSMCPNTSADCSRRPKNLLKALIRIRGLAKKLNSEATVIIATPHHSDQKVI